MMHYLSLQKLYFFNPFHTTVSEQLLPFYVREDFETSATASSKLNIFNGMPIRCTVFPRNPTLLPWDMLPDSFLSVRYVQQSIQASNGSGGLDGMLLGNLAVAMNFTAETMDASD
uniref:Uncharacterized protein n=1 Tax=Anopheles maculatus TaxID=74869 RepID=A0A182SJZ7_9DIPT